MVLLFIYQINAYRFVKTKVLCIYFFPCLFFILFSCKEEKVNVIQLNLGTNNYRELILRIQTFNNSTFNDPNLVKYNGINKGNSWNFCYPDSLHNKSVSFVIQETAYIDTLSRYIGFKYICNKDTLGTTILSFANKSSAKISATYLRTDTFPNSFGDVDINGNAILKTVLIDFYLLMSFQDEELLSALEVTKIDFYGNDVDSPQYNTELNKYKDLVKKYPDSHVLIQMLDDNLSLFKSKNDVQKVFDCFTYDNRNSFFGKRVNQYLTNNYFKNSILKEWDTGESKAIITDSAKYNLVLFSSAWCRPCIEEIPLLKKIYEDLSNKLDMVYVSIDDSRTVEEWRQLMKKENIPWRSVLAEDDVDNIIEKYHVLEIPYCLFVHIDGFMEAIDVRNTSELNYLYKTVLADPALDLQSPDKEIQL